MNTDNSATRADMLGDLCKHRRRLPADFLDGKRLVCHPDVAKQIRAALRGECTAHRIPPIASAFPIEASEYVPKHPIKRRYWQFPTEQYWEYGPEDEQWCRFFGIGHEVVEYDESELLMFVVAQSAVRFEAPDRSRLFGGGNFRNEHASRLITSFA